MYQEQLFISSTASTQCVNVCQFMSLTCSCAYVLYITYFKFYRYVAILWIDGIYSYVHTAGGHMRYCIQFLMLICRLETLLYIVRVSEYFTITQNNLRKSLTGNLLCTLTCYPVVLVP
jgi:hypothetical protein